MDEAVVAAAFSAGTEHEIRPMISERAFQSASPDDITRVSAQLAHGGWPPSKDLDA